MENHEEMMEKFVDMLMESSKEKKYKHVGLLDANESDDWLSMVAATDLIHKKVDELKAEAEMISARKTIFWYKLRASRGLGDRGNLRINKKRLNIEIEVDDE